MVIEGDDEHGVCAIYPGRAEREETLGARERL
jgi:hypothetical protein